MRVPHSPPGPHDHSFGQEESRAGERRTWIVVALTAVTMVVEIAAGVAFGSMALLADGLHMASHAVALTIAAILLAIVVFFLSLSVVGAILVSLIALIDSILLLAGVDWTITGWLTETISKVIYNYFLMQNYDVTTGDLATDWVNPEEGAIAGAEVASMIARVDNEGVLAESEGIEFGPDTAEATIEGVDTAEVVGVGVSPIALSVAQVARDRVVLPEIRRALGPFEAVSVVLMVGFDV